MKKLNLFLLIFITLSSIIVSCDDNEDPTNPTNYDQQQVLAQNYAFIQDVYSDIFDMLCQASGDSALMASGSGSIAGAIVTYTSGTEIFTFTFPAKSTNAKTGTFTADLDGDFQKKGTVAHITFDEFKVGGSLITGSNDITNTDVEGAKTTGTTITYSDSIFNAKIIKGVDTITVNATYSVDWMIGDTTTLVDDQYWFSGNIAGYANPNKSFTASVPTNSKVLVTPSCQYIQSGIVNAVTHTLDINNNPKTTTVSIDFGSGCDNLVTITMNGTIITFPM